MKYSNILNKSQSAILWIYRQITNKFTNIFRKLDDWFPAINKYPLLKYSLIPLLIGLFFLFRYMLKLAINELASWSSGFLGETSGFALSEKVIVFSVIAVFIGLRIVLKIGRQKKKNAIE